MKKFKKLLSVLCAVCMMLSLAVSASAASLEDDPYYFGIDWSQVDTSMCIPGTEYHRYPQSPISMLATADRNVFSGWVRGVPANPYPGTSNTTLVTGLAFESDETGVVTVTFTDSQDPSKSDVNVSIYDKDEQLISDYFSLAYNSTAPVSKSFNVDPTHEYNLFISHQGSGLQNVRLTVDVG